MNMKFKIKSGFTLLEILVYIAVFSIIIAVLTSFIVWATHSNIKAQAMRETLNNVRDVMETMVYEIRNAQGVYLPTTTSSQLSLETILYLPVGETSTYIDFFLCGNQICFKKEFQAPVPLTSSQVEIKNLSFSQISTSTTSPSIQIGVRAEYKNPQGLSEYRASVAVTSTASLRSY